MTDVSDNGMFEREGLAFRALDLEGATTEDAGPEDPSADVSPDRDTDGSLVGDADAAADEAASRGEAV
jgi:hypothetical protein